MSPQKPAGSIGSGPRRRPVRHGIRQVLDRLRTGTIDADEAVELGVAADPAVIIGEFVVDLDGVETRVVGEGADRRQVPVSIPRFSKLALTDQLMHTVASPAVAYLLFVIGLALIVFELYTAGVGVAGLVGAGALVLACYGLDTLPAGVLGGRAAGVLDGGVASTCRPACTVWTGVGVVALVVGSFALFEGSLSLSWITLLVGIVGISSSCSPACRPWCVPASPPRPSAASW